MSARIDIGKSVVWYYGEEYLVISMRQEDKLPEEVNEAWHEMIDFIDEYNENRLNTIHLYFKIFLMDMENRGFTREQVEHELKCYYFEKNKSK